MQTPTCQFDIIFQFNTTSLYSFGIQFRSEECKDRAVDVSVAERLGLGLGLSVATSTAERNANPDLPI